MPRYKRYGPISHDINSDPEVWEFTNKFGDRAFRTLIEVLMIIDRNENRWRLVGDWSGNLSRKVRQSVATVWREVDHMIAAGWLLVEERAADGSPTVLSASKYAEYHRKKETKNKNGGNEGADKKPQIMVPTILSYPNLHNNKIQTDGKIGILDLPLKRELNPKIKEVADRIYSSDRKKFDRLVVWIKQAQQQCYRDDVIAEALLQFERYAGGVRDWYPYLDKIIDKVEKDLNAKEAQRLSEQGKEELKEIYAEARKHS